MGGVFDKDFKARFLNHQSHAAGLALYSDLLLDLGVEGKSYEEAGAWRYRMVPSAMSSLDAVEEGPSPRLVPRLAIHSRHLETQGGKMLDVIEAWAIRPRFDELARIEFLVKSWLDEWVSRLAEASRQFADWDASAPFSAARYFLHQARGLGSLGFVKELRARVAEPGGVAEVAGQLSRIHARLRTSPRRVVWAGSVADSHYAKLLCQRTSPERVIVGAGEQIGFASAPANNALRVASQVNHCYATWKGPSLEHEHSAALAVAAEILRHKILHRRLREEGGAYGGAATYSPEDSVFSMSSFRDPRLEDTYKDMAEAVQELLLEGYSQDAVEEAIVGVVKGLDRPLQPAAQAFEAERLARRGITPAMRKDFRLRVLRVTREQVTRSAETWLTGAPVSRSAAVGSSVAALGGLQPIDLAMD